MTDNEGGNVTPRFLQIVEFVREQIQSGNLAEHSPLPSERKVSEQFGVSRMTARRALQAIESDGMAYSYGRRGRFVSPARFRYDIGKTFSLAAQAKHDEIDLEIRVIEAGECEAQRAEAQALKVEVGEKLIKYTRLFLIKNHPTFIEVEYLIAASFPQFLEHSLDQSTALLIEKEYGRIPTTGDILIRMRSLQNHEAELLGIPTYLAGVELEQTSHDQDGQPILFDRQIWRGELAEFSGKAIIRQT